MMRHLQICSILLILLTGFNAAAQGARMVLEGHYTGKNLYIQNPESPQVKNVFCIESITINGRPVPFDNASAFEIRLDSLGLQPGDSLVVVIDHFDGCKPKIIYSPPPVHDPLFEIVGMEFRDSILYWTTKNESGARTFVIEQYRWNKWTPVGEVGGSGSIAETTYQFRPAFHSGHNLFRVKQVDTSLRPCTSDPVRFLNMRKAPSYEVDQRKRQVVFSYPTRYEVYDAAGNCIKRGTGEFIDCSTVQKGSYILNYDNTTVPIHFGKIKPEKGKEEPLPR